MRDDGLMIQTIDESINLTTFGCLEHSNSSIKQAKVSTNRLSYCNKLVKRLVAIESKIDFN